jgi:competence protein ComEA
VGPVTAEKIIEYRKEEGSFASVDSLTEVSGIGPKTLEKIEDEITY